MRHAALCLLVAFAACGGSDTSVGLRLDDFPSGWRQYGADSKKVTCKSILAAEKGADAHQRSPQFEHPDGFVVGSTVYRYADAAKAGSGFQALSGETTGRCLARSLGSAKTTPLDVAAVGDERAGVRAHVAATKKHPVAAYDLVVVRTGRSVAELIFAGVRKPFDQRLREQLTAKLAERLKAPSP
jgi:hypothetical protein